MGTRPRRGGARPRRAPVVAGIDVEEVIGDEARVDEVFGGSRARAALPVLAKAVEALCALDDLELDDVRGGTFVRLADERFAWLPALVHAPSPRFDRERDDLVAKLRSRNDALFERFGRPEGEHLGVDLGAGTGRLDVPAAAAARCARDPPRDVRARGAHVGVGRLEPARSRDACAVASAALIDAIEERDLWEISTPVFATDEPTAWAIAAFVCDRAGGDAVLCAPESEGLSSSCPGCEPRRARLTSTAAFDGVGA